MLPLLAAGIGGALSLFQGFQSRNDQKKASKHAALQAAMDREEFLRAQNENRAAVEAANAYNQGAWLAATSRNRAETERVNARNLELGTAYLALPKVDLKAMVADAEAAGFNPLTVIRNGGMAGYSKSVELPGYQMMIPTAFHETPYQQQHVFQAGQAPTSAGPAPVQGVGSVFAGALQDGFSTFMSENRIMEQRDFQREMLNASLAGIQRGKKAGNSTAGSFGYVPGTVSAGGDIKIKKQPELWFAGTRVLTDPKTSPASDYTDRWGDEGPGAWVSGMGVMMRDFQHNMKDMSFLEIMRKIDRWTEVPLVGGAVRSTPIPPLAPLGFPM